MHSTAGLPTESSFAARNTEKSEQHEKIEKAKIASNNRTRSPQTSLIPPDLPPALAAQLVTVTSSRDLLSAHIASSDRKLRRLLCRYTNQIQYGCKNLYCTVPSCLSCRRRKSRTPVRKYTDATARALASHIVEEQGEKGLCHSDPVVPWFETPGSRSGTHGTESKSKANGHMREKANGHSVEPGNGHVVYSMSKRKNPMPSPKQAEPSLSQDVPKENGSDTRPRSLVDELAGKGPFGTETQCRSEEHPPQLRERDSRSFTQAVFDSFSLRSLWSASAPSAGPSISSPGLRPTNAAEGQLDNTSGQNGHVHTGKDSDVLSVMKQPTDSLQSKSSRFVSDGMSSTFDEAVRPARPVDERNFLEQTWDDTSTALTTNGFDIDSKANEENVKLDTEGLLETSAPDIEHSSSPKSRSAQELSWKQADEGPAQVAPFLSEELLNFFTRWQYFKLRKGPLPWPVQWIPEPYAPFLHNSMFYSLRDAERTLQSIRDWHDSLGKRETYDNNHFDRDAVRRNILRIVIIVPPAETFRSLRLGLADAYHLPIPWQAATRHSHKRSSTGQLEYKSDLIERENDREGWLSDEDTARICTFGIMLLGGGCAALRHPISTGTRSNTTMKLPLEFFQICNNFAKVFPVHRLSYLKDPALLEVVRDPQHGAPTYSEVVRHITSFIDYFDDYDAKRLFLRITDIIATRQALHEMERSRRKSSPSLKKKPTVAGLIAGHLVDYDVQSRNEQSRSASMDAIRLSIEWVRLVFVREWNGNAVIKRTSALGGALLLLTALFAESRKIALHPDHFCINFIAERLNMVDLPGEWLSFRANSKTVHLLSYPFLFEPRVLVTCFRAINYSKMTEAAVDARAMDRHVREFTDGSRYPGVNNNTALLGRLIPHMVTNFVITVRRDNILADAIDQIWRRQHRELMRPLKVRMGMEEGEQGIDIGGVQQEFFRILFAQALDPGYGMFTIDERTRMTWFRPGSVEPLYKFEVLGIFMSLAVYNSITLPLTFPLAFYRQLLGLKVKKLHHITDGWPELAAGLQQMLDWSEGDVGDVFARTYEFSYEAFGKHVNIDMKRFDKHTAWPAEERKKGKEKMKTASFELPTESTSPKSPTRDVAGEEAPMVTNTNREQYVKDYIVWLTHRSIEPQYNAFAKGFYTCLDRTALSIFTPEALQAVVEGYTEIDVQGLEAVTKYEDGFDEFSSTVQDFWQIVRNFSTDQHRRLLEFVTASDRVPVNGIKSVQFIIQRNGSGDNRLPTSMTCFGRLLLPQYSSRQVLEDKLTKAIENSEGFGVA